MSENESKNEKDGEDFLGSITYFQVYEKGQLDFSEKRLLKLIKLFKKKEIEQVLKVILKEYKARNIALAWKSGEPVYIPINNKEKEVKTDTNTKTEE